MSRIRDIHKADLYRIEVLEVGICELWRDKVGITNADRPAYEAALAALKAEIGVLVDAILEREVTIHQWEANR